MGKTIKVGTMSGLTIQLPTEKGGCVCRNIRQRRAAMKQARTIFLDLELPQRLCNAIQGAKAEAQPGTVTLAECLKGRRVCPACVRNALLIQTDVRGESYVEAVLNVLNPLPSPKRNHKK